MRKQSFATNSNISTRQEFQVVKRTTRPEVKGVKLGHREFRFGNNGTFKTDDPSIARDIHYTQGQGGDGDVLVIPLEKKSKPGHTRTFTVPALPWHKENRLDNLPDARLSKENKDE